MASQEMISSFRTLSQWSEIWEIMGMRRGIPAQQTLRVSLEDVIVELTDHNFLIVFIYSNVHIR